MKHAIILNHGIASAALALALMATPALAQQAAPADAAAPASEAKDVIVVTGSISRNPSAATASPITSLGADDLEKRGQTTISDVLQTLSANNAGTIGSNWSALGGFSTGAAAVSLRGFNDAYTLTVFNGMRMAIYPLPDDGYRGIVDLNTIPESIVDRIDVLQDGASATYGSDAIAGVVNVVIKKEIQGLHINMSSGISQKGDDAERRIDATFGIGKLARDGYNLYINAEYQKNDPLFFNQRPGTFTSSANRSGICGIANGNGTIGGQPVPAGAPVCENNGVLNGIQFNNAYNGFQATKVGFVQPIDPTTGQPVISDAPGGQAPFQLLNPAAGCQGLTAVNLTMAQQASPGAPATVCQQDITRQYGQFLPDITRMGANLKFTKNIGAAQAYVMFNYLDTKTSQIGNGPFSNPQSFGTGQTTGAGSTPGGAPIAYANTFLPVYVCPQGTGSINGSGTIVASGCSAANGMLNPNNPFAAQGKQAQLYELMNRPNSESTDARTFRISGGIDGSFGKGWTYGIAATTSWINLTTTQYNYINLQNLLNAVAQGTFNFVDQNANTPAQWNAIAPANTNVDRSKLTQIQANIGKDLFTLPGGSANLTVGAGYRFESVNSPSANAPNEANPYNRYLSINAFAVSGSRRVWTGFYELSVPLTDTLKLKAEGSYDSYSTNYNASYKRFSPKFEAQFRPIKELKLRGTYSQGFAVPSFAEAGEILPAIGYLSATITCSDPNYTAWCASHASNPTYYQNNLQLGTGSNSNPQLKPQKSDSFTFGAVIQPTPRLVFTIDYWHTKISNYILPAAANYADVAQYYLNGTTSFADGTTILKAAPDPKNPNALPTILALLGSYSNAQSEIGSGIDFTASLRQPIGNNGLKLVSSFNASYLAKLEQTEASGAVQAYAGYLSPCNISSCSGAPKWRGSWQNTLDFDGKGSTTLTAYYTSGYELVATDFGGSKPGQCAANVGFGVPASYLDGATPVACKANATFSMDWSGSVKVQDHFTLYANILNVLNNKPPFDPSAQYGATQFNASWASSNFIGRYFRIGAKIDF